MQQTYTYERLSKAFLNYLMERFDGDSEEVRLIFETAEREISNTLKDYFGTNYESIYEIKDSNEVDDFRKKIKVHPILKGIDMNHEPRYTEVLKWYRLFLKAFNSESIPIPIPVPGEYEPIPEMPAHTFSETRELKTRQSTIFLEGEAGEAQEKVYRERNIELRHACIDHFKALHGGRIVCECCGFDFAARYDIQDEYIEVHHRFPFSHTEGEHPVDAITDLVPLCANCHRMIHHGMGGRGNCMSLDELKSKLR